jgi:hypothetical protein
MDSVRDVRRDVRDLHIPHKVQPLLVVVLSVDSSAVKECW